MPFYSTLKSLLNKRIFGMTYFSGHVHFKTILYMGFRATLKFKVALNPMYRIYSNFAKSYILSCLSKFYKKKKLHCAVFEI